MRLKIAALIVMVLSAVWTGAMIGHTTKEHEEVVQLLTLLTVFGVIVLLASMFQIWE